MSECNKGFRAKVSIKPLSTLEKNAKQKWVSNARSRLNQTVDYSESTETKCISIQPAGRKQYADINQLNSVKVKHENGLLPRILEAVETSAHGMTISNEILLRRENIKERLSKNLVC